MPDPAVERWKQEHPIHLWRYTESARNYPGWHLTAPDASCHAIVGLLDLMLEASFRTQKELRITRPTQSILSTPNNRGGNAAWTTVETLLLKHPKGDLEPSRWQLEAEDGRVSLTLGEERIQELRRSFAQLPEGVDDYCMSPSGKDRGSEILWFWAFPAR